MSKSNNPKPTQPPKPQAPPRPTQPPKPQAPPRPTDTPDKYRKEEGNGGNRGGGKPPVK